jgi:hypothetical protein
MCENATNPLYHGPTLRALLMAMDSWADKGVKPPDSNYPTLQGGTLASLDEARKLFPKIPGRHLSAADGRSRAARLRARIQRRGRPAGPAAKIGPRYNVYVPKPNDDGLDVGGVRPIEIRVPIGTHAGWNVRAKESRGPNLCALDGSFIPFVATKEQRTAGGDPRKSLEERYSTHDGYVKAVRDAARQLVTEHFLIEEDAARFIKQAESSGILSSSSSR